jgi:alkylation response protein AidB-like acyl-CoA dehydrogenase
MIPDLRARSQETEELKCLPKATVDEFKGNEFFRVCMPKKYGGFEMDWDVLCRLVMEVAKGCASSAWVLAVFAEHANTIAGFSDQAQAEVWADGPDVAISSGGNTGTKESIAKKNILTPTKGGYLLNGWSTFSSGCDHATWVTNISTLEGEKGAMQILTPITPDQIIHNWDTFALIGTGSKFVEFKDCFIPDHRAIPAQDGLDGTTPGAKLYDNPIFRLPRLAIAPYSLVSVSIGTAAGVVEEFIEAMDTRVNRFDNKISQFQSIQMRVAESAADAFAAESVMFRNIKLMTDILASGEKVPDLIRLQGKRDMAYCNKLSQAAVDRLFAAWGGNGLYMSNRIQQALRDVKAAGAHHQTNWDIYLTAYGRVALGLDAGPVRF